MITSNEYSSHPPNSARPLEDRCRCYRHFGQRAVLPGVSGGKKGTGDCPSAGASELLAQDFWFRRAGIRFFRWASRGFSEWKDYFTFSGGWIRNENLQSSCRVVPSSARVLPRLDAFWPLLDHLKNLICYLFWVRIQRYHRRQH